MVTCTAPSLVHIYLSTAQGVVINRATAHRRMRFACVLSHATLTFLENVRAQIEEDLNFIYFRQIDGLAT